MAWDNMGISRMAFYRVHDVVDMSPQSEEETSLAISCHGARNRSLRSFTHHLRDGLPKGK